MQCPTLVLFPIFVAETIVEIDESLVVFRGMASDCSYRARRNLERSFVYVENEQSPASLDDWLCHQERDPTVWSGCDYILGNGQQVASHSSAWTRSAL